MKIDKYIFFFEFLIFVIAVANLESIFPDNTNIVEEIEELHDVQLGSRVYITLFSKNYGLTISEFAAKFLVYDKLEKLREGDKILVIKRKNKSLGDWINYQMGHQSVLGISHQDLGVILDFDAYRNSENSVSRIVLKFVIFLICLTVIGFITMSWVLTFCFMMKFDKQSSLQNNLFIRYKLRKNNTTSAGYQKNEASE